MNINKQKFLDWLTYNKKTPLEKEMYKRAAGVASRWKHTYFENEIWFKFNNKINNKACKNKSSKTIYDNLVALGKSPTPEQVNKVIGNESWTKVWEHEGWVQ